METTRKTLKYNVEFPLPGDNKYMGNFLKNLAVANGGGIGETTYSTLFHDYTPESLDPDLKLFDDLSKYNDSQKGFTLSLVNLVENSINKDQTLKDVVKISFDLITDDENFAVDVAIKFVRLACTYLEITGKTPEIKLTSYSEVTDARILRNLILEDAKKTKKSSLKIS